MHHFQSKLFIQQQIRIDFFHFFTNSPRVRWFFLTYSAMISQRECGAVVGFFLDCRSFHHLRRLVVPIRFAEMSFSSVILQPDLKDSSFERFIFNAYFLLVTVSTEPSAAVEIVKCFCTAFLATGDALDDFIHGDEQAGRQTKK